MNKTESLICDALTELKNARLSIQPVLSEETVSALNEKYGMLFFGENLNMVLASMFGSRLSQHWKQDVAASEVLAAIPTVCSSLGMALVPLISPASAGGHDAPATDFFIRLY